MDPSDVELLQRMADAADALTLSAWRSGRFDVVIKEDGSPVTEIDLAVESTLLELVAAEGRGDAFLGEEVGAVGGSSRRTWVVDGIDGTRNFVDGRDRWSTLIALAVDGIAVAGAVTSPALGRRWSTTASGTAQVAMPTNGPPGLAAAASSGGGDGGVEPAIALTVSTTTDLAAATIAVWPPEPWANRLLAERHPGLLALVGQPTPASVLVDEPVPHGAVPVADGRIDAMVAFSGQAWDHAGPSALVAAAGGRSTALDGRPAFDTGAMVYSNGLLHDDLIAVMTTA